MITGDDNKVYIYYGKIEEAQHKAMLRKVLPMLPVDQRKKIQSFYKWQDAQASMLGKVLLLRGLYAIDHNSRSLELEYSKFGKPFLRKRLVSFNISHSGELVVCAVSKSETLGIDIEQIETIDFQIYVNNFTIREWQCVIANENPQKIFYNLWTSKEAITKADGRGLTIPLNTLEVLGYTSFLDSTPYYLTEIAIDSKYVCCLATTKQNTSVKIINVVNDCSDLTIFNSIA